MIINNSKNIIRLNTIKRLIFEEVFLFKENVQLADKYYKNTGKLNQEDINFIYNLTGQDNTTKLMCDLYYSLKMEYEEQTDVIINLIKKYYNQIKNYNKNVFPIKNFDIYNMNKSVSPYILKIREYILDRIKELPSIAIRNLKNEIRQERDSTEFEKYKNNLDYFLAQMSLLGNRDESLVKNIYKKMFKSGITLSGLIDFAEEKENLLGGKEFTKQSVKSMIDDNYHYELDIVYEKENVMVIDVTGQHGIKDIGCNSLWCFTYGNQVSRMWNDYSTNGHAYVIIDFDENSDSSSFMYVLIAPLAKEYTEDDDDKIPLYDMSNQQVYNPNDVINGLVGKNIAKKIFTFKD